MIRLRELRAEKGVSLRELAQKLGLSYSSVGKYERNEAQPSFDILFKLADFFNVTIDYLIGYTDIRTKNLEYKSISEKTGLSVKAIETLVNFKNGSEDQKSPSYLLCAEHLNTINLLLGVWSDTFITISNYLHFSATHFKNFYNDDMSTLAPISELELWDDVSKTSYSDDWDMWSKALLLMVEEDLTSMRNSIQHQKNEEYLSSKLSDS